MTQRKVKYKPNDVISKCPKCDNNTEFTIKSDYCAEDCCEIWAVCKCGYDPTQEEGYSGYRLEDVWGGVSDDNCQDALTLSWNETINSIQAKSQAQIKKPIRQKAAENE